MKYSKNFNFFFANQIQIWVTNNGKTTSFTSAIKSTLFKKVETSKRLSQEEIKNYCRQIHHHLIENQTNIKLLSSEFVLFNPKTQKIARYMENGIEYDIMLFSNEISAEENQEPGEHIYQCGDLPINFQTELIKQVA